MTKSLNRYEGIPGEMKELKQWVIWGVNNDDPKAPHNPLLPTLGAKANDSSTWAGFDAALAAAARLGRGGIGFEFGVQPCGIAGVDLDHVINDAGKIEAWAAEIVELMNSYTEYSPSGHGIHIFCRLTEPLSSFCAVHKKHIAGEQQIEVYDTVRYFTITGRVYGDLKPLNERTDALKKVCDKYLAKSERQERKEGAQYSSQVNQAGDIGDAELLERMFKAPSKGDRIRRLYEGDTTDYGGDDSAADMALCNELAYATGNDAARMDRMFRQSGLMRDKWDEKHGAQTYGQRTIDEAIRTTSTYTPPVRVESKSPTGSSRAVMQSLSTVEAEDENVKQVLPVSEFLPEFVSELLKSREGKAIPTGFEALDELLCGGLCPGLYVVGAISSLGKTTFTLQIADNLAKDGHGVMIFSLEMSRREMMAKTVSREASISLIDSTGNRNNALTTLNVLRCEFRGKPEQESIVRQVLAEYKTWGKNLTIIEGIGNIGTSTVRDCVEAYRSAHDGKPPVVVIDYLQIMAHADVRASDKQNVDKNVLELKRLSREYKIPVIVISSFNRENYSESVSMAAFKESGAIEYGSDVLIGLQLAGIDRRDGESKEAHKMRVQMTLEGANATRRNGNAVQIEAKILKQRNGAPGRVNFNFHSKFNYFQESKESKSDV